MSKLSDLVGKGVRLIVADDEVPPEIQQAVEAEVKAAPASRPPAPPRPREREIPAQAFEAPPPKRIEHSQVSAEADFALVYKEAGIQLPPHGYGVDKVGEMLENRRLASLAREVKASAVLAALEAAGVAIRDIVQDAVLRDKALDAFEAAKQREAHEIRARNESRIGQLQSELDALLKKINTEIENLKHASDSAEQAFKALQERKRKEEERLHTVVSHFIEGADNPITTAPKA